MLHVILFLVAQLLAFICSSELRPMTPATTTTTTAHPETITPELTITPEQARTAVITAGATTETVATHNNVLVFLNECIDDPSDNLLSDTFKALALSARMVHCIVPVKTVKKVLIETKDVCSQSGDETPPEMIRSVFSVTYHINNSPYCIILPHENDNALKLYDQDRFLDLSSCTPLVNRELLSENSSISFCEQVLERIQEIEAQLSSLGKDRQKKESAVLRQLFSKQMRAHDLFAADQANDDRCYTQELSALAAQPWFFYFLGHGASGHSIAGFDFATGELWKTAKLLNHLSTGYLIIYSCHAGGINREILAGRYNLSSENFPEYKELEPLINSLTFSYNVILCSPAGVTSKTAPVLTVSTIKKIATSRMTDSSLIQILGDSSILLGQNPQINQLPLIQRPYQTVFKPFLPASSKIYSPKVIDKNFLITSVNQHKHCSEKSTFSIKDTSIIQTDQAMITRGLTISPIIEMSNPQHEKRVLHEVDCYGHEEKILQLFPVVSDTIRKKHTTASGQGHELYPHYPFFLSQQTGTSYHYLPALLTKQTGLDLPGEKGVFLCLRDLFFNANTRSSTNLYFIKSIMGTNDIPQDIIDKKIFGENFPQEGASLILSNVALLTFCQAKTHYLLGAFSWRQSYYFFALSIEGDYTAKQWGSILQLPSREVFEEKLCFIEDLACSKIYNRLARYPASHPQHELIKQYLDRKKSIFLDFQNSYPLFKDDHLPEDADWQELPKSLEKKLLIQQAHKQQEFATRERERTNQALVNHAQEQTDQEIPEHELVEQKNSHAHLLPPYSS